MSPFLKYTLARFGILIVCVAPALLLFRNVSAGVVLIKLVIAFAVSAALSFFLLRQWRDEVAQQLVGTTQERAERKERLRAALAGDDESTDAKPTDAKPTDAKPSDAKRPPSTQD